ncbi:alkyl hydroperoxide reductase [Mycolicibacterium fortuitum]|uniref:alkyl hydroperoxide reductase n=1 Tax=Mycolicibacterium fortuitum TaxID=1766 RepID=UPI001CE06220|nr:alkyl hydroperoxide reductase [Mycolicibacterium fortuitum]
MSTDNVKEAILDYVKDLKLHLSSALRCTELSPQQLRGLSWQAAATKSERLLQGVLDDPVNALSAQTHDAALSAAAIMAMNNVFYRSRDQLGGSYENLHPSGPIYILVDPGVPHLGFELCALAESAINGCGHLPRGTRRRAWKGRRCSNQCHRSHPSELRRSSREWRRH